MTLRCGISKNLEEFRALTGKHYGDLVDVLEDKYCWKCPMRSTSSETFCREAEIWIRLSNAFEQGIQEELLSRNVPTGCLEMVTTKVLQKKMKNEHKSSKFHKLSFLEADEDLSPQVKKGSFMMVDEDTKSIKKGDLVLMPRSCPLSLFWFLKMSQLDEMPLKLFKVMKVSHEKGLKCIKTEEGFDVPIEYIYGVVVKIVMEGDSLYTELGLKSHSNLTTP